MLALVTEPASGLGGTTITTAQVVTLIVGVLLPMVVALVTKYETSPAVRAILLLVLSGVSGVLNDWLVADGAFDWGQAILSALTTFIVGVATLYGLWKPTGVSDRLTAVGSNTGPAANRVA